MSQVYASEPSTSGRVVFETTHGPLEMQLWCRECPTATRVFLQLCMDGFFDTMVFHRIVPDFLIQTGAVRQSDATKDNNNNSSLLDSTYRTAVLEADEALQRRKYEVHSRLRFNHRGQVAMALGVNDDDDAELQPQFFITLDEAPYLDGKHVLFGTVAGPTIFNAIRISKTLVDEATNQPVDLEDAPCIRSVKIVENPVFSDLVPHASVPWRQEASEDKQKKKKKKRKGKKDVNVLSFGDELEDGLDQHVGIQSSHDVVASAVLGKQVDEQVRQTVALSESDQRELSNESSSLSVEKTAKSQSRKLPSIEQANADTPLSPEARGPKQDIPPGIGDPSTVLRKAVPHMDSRPSGEVPAVSLVEARRAKYKSKSSTNKATREGETMAKLFAFQRKVRGSDKTNSQSGADKDDSLASRMLKKAKDKKLDSAEVDDTIPTYHGQILEEDSGENFTGGDWMKTKFRCRKHMDHGPGEDRKGGDGRDMDDYMVVDEKHRENRRGHHKRRKHEASRPRHHWNRKDQT